MIKERKKSLGFRLLAYVLFLSTIITVILTFIQLLLDYQADIYQINQRFQVIEVSYINSLSSSVWHMDEEQINIVLGGIKNLPEIENVSLFNEEGKVIRKLGESSDNQTIEKHR